MRYNAVIFDFDGTICDTGEGIMKSAKYALEAFGYKVGDYEELKYFIGPPLLITFQEKFGANAAKADELVRKFRERYTNKGVFESELYEGIKPLLAALKKTASSWALLRQSHRIISKHYLITLVSSHISTLSAALLLLLTVNQKPA